MTLLIMFAFHQGHLSLHNNWGHLDNVWGVAGGLRPVKNITKQMELLLKEYLLSRDIKEAQRCIIALEVPHFHHELVYEVSCTIRNRFRSE
jgi:programmed cell death protein 4